MQEIIVHRAGLHVEASDTAIRPLLELLTGIGMELSGFLIAAEADADGTILVAGCFQSLDDIQGDDDTALHIQNARTIGLAILNAEGVGAEGVGIKHGIKVTGKDHRSTGTVCADHTGNYRGTSSRTR